jgi:peroxiredoxin
MEVTMSNSSTPIAIHQRQPHRAGSVCSLSRTNNLTLAGILSLVSLSIILFGLPVPVAADQQVKDFTLPSATNDTLIHLSDYAGKVVLLNWWRTSCTWSQAEAPRLAGLYKKYHAQGFEIVGVSDDTADSVAQVPAYLKRYGITWPVGLNDQGEFIREIRPMGSGNTPENYLITRSGQIRYLGTDRNPEDWTKLVQAVTQAMAEKAPAAPPIPRRSLEPAPPFGLPDLQGKKTALANFSGKPLVVNFFNANSCDWTGAVLSKLNSEYSGKGLQVVGIDLYDPDAAIQQCKAKYHASYPILRGDQTTQMAWIGENKGWATFFVSNDGKVLKKITDSIDHGIEQPVFSKYAEYLISKRK